jgi:hypothetical protein
MHASFPTLQSRECGYRDFCTLPLGDDPPPLAGLGFHSGVTISVDRLLVEKTDPENTHLD